jgi:23S rRNA (pseudouridine1915-N3)-methyltransferase
MRLVTIGRLRPGPESDLFDRYNSRLRPRLTLVELPEARGPAPTVRRDEAAALLASLPKAAFVVPLDLGGPPLTSEAFAGRLNQWLSLSRPVCFMVGGAYGLDAAVIRRADYVLSFGLMTWPHFMVRAMLAEQLYRAHAISQGHPYHKSDRPEL